MFSFIVNRLGALKHIPFLPHLFDAMLKMGTFFSNRRVLDFIDEIEQEILSWENTSLQLHKFGGIQFNTNGKELGHIHGNGFLDILFSRQTKIELIKEGKVKEHHTFRNSGWITFSIETQQDKVLALELLKRSYQMSQ